MRQNGIRPAKFRFEKGGRVGKMGGGMSTKRKDMASGYYEDDMGMNCLLYTSPSPRDRQKSRMPSSA